MKTDSSRVVSSVICLKSIVMAACMGCMGLFPSVATAQVSILLVGSTTGTGSNSWTSDSTARPFDYTDVRTHLAGILQAANMGTVNVALENRYRTGSDAWGTKYSYNLLSWFHWPYPANDEVNNRWPSLRNQGPTAWDHVVLIEDSYTVERTPGLYAQAVAMIGEEVEKAGKKPLLLMTWPGSGSTSTIAHYKEVNFRIGQSSGYPVAPAGSVIEALGVAPSTTHPTGRGAYIAAATIYSRLYNAVAPSSYDPKIPGLQNYQADAQAAYNTVVNLNNNPPSYTGPYTVLSTYMMLHDKRRTIHFTERGSSTEEYIRTKASSMGNNLLWVPTAGARATTPSSSWPRPVAWNHGRDGVFSTGESGKSYQINPSIWALAFGHTYHARVWDLSPEAGNDVHLSELYEDDVKMDHHMRANNQLPTARVLPLRTLWAAHHKQYPGRKVVRDSTNHLADVLDHAAAAYMHTMLSGRTPITAAPSPMTETYWAQKVGYEAAWRIGNLTTRAPGFRVLPSAATKTSVTPDSTETMSVNFVMKPRANVTLRVTSNPESAVTITPRTLTFTPDNHATVQQIRFRGMPGTSTNQSFKIELRTESGDVVYQQLYDEWPYSVTRTTTQSVTAVEGTTTSVYCAVNGSVGVTAVAGATVDNTTFVGPFNGTVALNGDSVVYTPNANFTGPDSFAYNVNVGGTVTRTYLHVQVVAPTIEIRGNAVAIAPGDTSPTAADGTDFGMIQNAGPVDRTFTVHNLSGGQVLNLTGSPRVSISGSTAFSLLQDATTPLSVGGQTSFQLRYAPTASGVHTATVTVTSSDPVFSPYTFRVTAARVVAPTVVNQLASSMGNKSARVNGQLTAGQMAHATLYWGTTDGGTAPGSWQNSMVINSVTGNFSHLATGLLPGTTYYFRSFVQNPAGSAWASSTASFSTLSPPPVFADVLEIPDATETDFYQVDLAPFVTDEDLPSDMLTYSKLNGPAWLSVSPLGVLSGTPARMDVGANTVTVRVADNYGNNTQADFLVNVEGLTLIPLVDGFELPNVDLGGIPGQNGWFGTQEAQVQSEVRFAGTRSLQLLPGASAYQRFSLPSSNVVWVDGRVRLENLADVVDVPPVPQNGGTAWFFNADGQLTVLSGSSWSVVPGQSAVTLGQWVRVTMALDYNTKTWRIFLNGQLAQDNLPMVGMPSRLAKLAITGQDSFVDDVSVTYQMPSGIQAGTTPTMITATGPISFASNGSPQGPSTAIVNGSTSTVTYSYRGIGGTTYGPSANKPVNAGSYEVVATVAADANFAAATSAPYAFTISPGVEGAPLAPTSEPAVAKSETPVVAAASLNEWAMATGGETSNYVDANGVPWTVHVFKQTGADTLTVTRPGKLEYLIVGGGGAGGKTRGGGGGAGGVLAGSMTVEAGSLPVMVGAGGLNASGTGIGGDSSLGGTIAKGGGNGGRHPVTANASVGGSGGGGGGYSNMTGAAGTSGQGRAGANGGSEAGAGGGGAGVAGTTGSGTTAGKGGDGIESSITGVLGWYGGGGGGMGTASAGGLGGGGVGTSGITGTATSGAVNTGGGGGGGGDNGGSGGSGIVVVRYQTDWARVVGGQTSVIQDEAGIFWKVHQFTNVGTSEIQVTRGGLMEYLVVAGGGAGGRARGGGGGAGGMLQGSTPIGSGPLPVTVGAGGLGGSGSGVGQDSVLGDLVAKGGGNGGRHPVTDNASVGGSGGGGGGKYGTATHNLGAAGTSGQGSSGGTSTSTTSGGGAGGGGAGAVGQSVSGSIGGTGGNGLQSAITGTLTWYAGGGGGASNSHTTNILGGLGGGGRGARSLSGTTDYATSGEPNTGGGGGGAGNVTGINGGDGGSGIVILRYQVTMPTMFVAE